MSYGGGYSTTSYGAQGGTDAGGFMEGSQGGSQGGGKASTYGKDTLRPVTIKQVLEAQQPYPQAEFKIDDVEVSQITFVGQIRNISTQATNVTYKLDDGTGMVEVKQWIDPDHQTHMMDTSDGTGAIDGVKSKQKLVEDTWAHVWGRLKDFGNKRHVGAHVIRPVADKMEIQYHLLEATYAHLYFSRGPLDQIKQEGGAGAGGGNDHYMQNGGGGGDQGTMVNGKPWPPVSHNARRIYRVMSDAPQMGEGLHVQNIAALAGMNVADVMKAGDEMLSHSMIFTTVDDNTWAVLEF